MGRQRTRKIPSITDDSHESVLARTVVITNLVRSCCTMQHNAWVIEVTMQVELLEVVEQILAGDTVSITVLLATMLMEAVTKIKHLGTRGRKPEDVIRGESKG